MTHGEKELDTMIREALSREEAQLYERLGNPTLPEMITEVFQGRMRWLTAGGMLFGLIFLAAAIYSLLQFLAAAEVAEMLRWATGLFFCLSSILAMKIWYWMEMQRNALTREIKRLELQVVHLASRLRDAGAA